MVWRIRSQGADVESRKVLRVPTLGIARCSMFHVSCSGTSTFFYHLPIILYHHHLFFFALTIIEIISIIIFDFISSYSLLFDEDIQHGDTIAITE